MMNAPSTSSSVLLPQAPRLLSAKGWAAVLAAAITVAVLAKIMVLVFIVVFIQKRPQGIFAMKGREA